MPSSYGYYTSNQPTVSYTPGPARLCYRPPVFSGNAIDLGDRQGRVLFSALTPRIALIDHFLDDMECAELISLTKDRLQPSTAYFSQDGSRQPHPSRTSWDVELGRAECALVARLEKRAASLCVLPDSHGEIINVLRYQHAQEFQPHYDWFNLETAAGQIQVKKSGQRLATVIMYLTDEVSGGSTVFPAIGLDIRPKKGAALYFCNVDINGNPDKLVLHSGAPVLSGEKLIATRWFRDQPQTWD